MNSYNMLNHKLRIGYLLASLVCISQLMWLLNHGFDEVWAYRLILGPLGAGVAAYLISYALERLLGKRIWLGWEKLDQWIMRPGVTAAFIIFSVLLIYLYCAGGHLFSSDGDFRYRASRAILENGNVIMYYLKDGTPIHCKYGLTHLLLAIPFHLAGKAFYNVIPQGFDWATIFTTSLMQFVTVGAVAVIFLICLDLGYSRKVSVTTALVVAFGSIAWPYSKYFFTEPLTGALLLAAIWQLIRFRVGKPPSSLAWSGLSLGLSGLNSPQVFLLAVPVLGIYVLYLLYPRPGAACQTWARGFNRLMYFCIPLALCLALNFGYNYLRYDSIFTTGYAGDRGFPSLIYDGSPGWSLAWWVGLEGYLFSPGKSVFLYSPVLVLSVLAFNRFYKKHREPAVLLICIAVLWLAFYTKWWAWHGDSAWGPRYMVPITYIWFLPLAEALSWWGRRGWGFKVFVPGLIAFGLVVQFAGIAVAFGDYIAQEVNLENYAEQYLLHYVPHFSPILGHWEMVLKQSKRLDFLWMGRPFGNIIVLIAVVMLNLLITATWSSRKKASA